MARVLVVDDDPDLRDVVEMVLSSAGHEVATAGGRVEGLAKAAEFTPDLMVLDIMMDQPDDGIAMAQTLRAQGVTTPIILLSSISKVTGLSYGMEDSIVPVDDFLEKPVAFDVLLARVNALLNPKNEE